MNLCHLYQTDGEGCFGVLGGRMSLSLSNSASGCMQGASTKSAVGILTSIGNFSF